MPTRAQLTSVNVWSPNFKGTRVTTGTKEREMLEILMSDETRMNFKNGPILK